MEGVSGRISVLLIEDDADYAFLVRKWLSRLSIDLKWADRLSSGLECLSTAVYDVVLLDLGLPDSRGIDTLESIIVQAPEAPVVVLTGAEDDGLAAQALKSGAEDYLVKGEFEGRLLPRTIRHARERKKAKRELRASEERYRRIVETTLDGVWILDQAGRITFANARMATLLGLKPTELVGRSVYEFVDEGSRPAIEWGLEQRRTGHAGRYDVCYRRRDGSELWAIVSASPLTDVRGEFIGSLGIVTDISERKRVEDERNRLEEQLRHAQKMEAIGQLAGGISHDFNNLLTVIGGYAQMLVKSFDRDDPRREEALEITKAATQASSLTRQLLTFSRRQVFAPKIVNLNAIVAETEKMLGRLIGEDIELEVVLDPELRQVRVDPTQIEQILTNLAVNARTAMPSGGKLTIETTRVELTGDEPTGFIASGQTDLPPGSYVVIAVSDSGVGMDADTRSQIFEPFFTTQEPGSGTGLGLATVYAIVSQSGGGIQVESEPGAGAQFTIYLPEVDELPDAEERPRAMDGQGSELILLVEDNDRVRSFAHKALTQVGYRVISVGLPNEALPIIEDKDSVVDILVTDVVMPEMSGKELAERLHSVRPETPVLYTSGYTQGKLEDAGVSDSVALLEKPFSQPELVESVRRTLDAWAALATTA